MTNYQIPVDWKFNANSDLYEIPGIQQISSSGTIADLTYDGSTYTGTGSANISIDIGGVVSISSLGQALSSVFNYTNNGIYWKNNNDTTGTKTFSLQLGSAYLGLTGGNLRLAGNTTIPVTLTEAGQVFELRFDDTNGILYRCTKTGTTDGTASWEKFYATSTNPLVAGNNNLSTTPIVIGTFGSDGTIDTTKPQIKLYEGGLYGTMPNANYSIDATSFNYNIGSTNFQISSTAISTNVLLSLGGAIQQVDSSADDIIICSTFALRIFKEAPNSLTDAGSYGELRFDNDGTMYRCMTGSTTDGSGEWVVYPTHPETIINGDNKNGINKSVYILCSSTETTPPSTFFNMDDNSIKMGYGGGTTQTALTVALGTAANTTGTTILGNYFFNNSIELGSDHVTMTLNTNSTIRSATSPTEYISISAPIVAANETFFYINTDDTGIINTGSIFSNKIYNEGNIEFTKSQTGKASTGSYWIMGYQNTPSTDGSNTGADFFINRYSDSSASSGDGYIDTPFSIKRSTGQVLIETDLSVYGTAVFGGNVLAVSKVSIQADATVTGTLLASGHICEKYEDMISAPQYDSSKGSSVAYALTAKYNIITGVATAGSPGSVLLPAVSSGISIVIFNRSGQDLYVYPPMTNAIESLTTNSPQVMSDGGSATFVCFTNGTWRVL